MRTKAILRVLARGREPRLAESVMRERAGLDHAVEHLTADAPAAFQLSVDHEAAS
ncbi:MAG TPA: hypothetical protein VND45_10260 [Thermoanaerobaculia bacterium]|jgi:hypothetical protein|nr:hypothetical protein [Thermoanaerobaculia bacterium]